MPIPAEKGPNLKESKLAQDWRRENQPGLRISSPVINQAQRADWQSQLQSEQKTLSPKVTQQLQNARTTLTSSESPLLFSRGCPRPALLLHVSWGIPKCQTPPLQDSPQFLVDIPFKDDIIPGTAINPELTPASLDTPQNPSVGTHMLQKMVLFPLFQEQHPMVSLECTSLTHQVNEFDSVQLQFCLWLSLAG